MELKEAIDKAYNTLAPNDEAVTLDQLYVETKKLLPALTREELFNEFIKK